MIKKSTIVSVAFYFAWTLVIASITSNVVVATLLILRKDYSIAGWVVAFAIFSIYWNLLHPIKREKVVASVDAYLKEKADNAQL